ncbi:MAG: hypothetical protein Q8O29_12515 [Polaromonas sp.]|nr:hypothetical protein [Polaromonas sp.]
MIKTEFPNLESRQATTRSPVTADENDVPPEKTWADDNLEWVCNLWASQHWRLTMAETRVYLSDNRPTCENPYESRACYKFPGH